MYRKTLFFLLFAMISYVPFCQNANPKRIVVTAPDIYNSRLCEAIAKAKFTPIPCPVIETKLIEHNTTIDTVLNHLSDYEWIALPSRNAIDAFFARSKELGLMEKVVNAKFCAIGKDQEYLNSFGVSTILKNTEPSPQGIVKALGLAKSTKKIAVLAPQVIGIPEPNVVPLFIDSLTANQWQVTRINAYTTKICSSKKTLSVIEQIKNGDIDLIAFTSTGEIQALISLVGGVKNLSKVPIACFGPYTSSNAFKLGLKPVFSAADFSSFQGYVDAITRYFN